MKGLRLWVPRLRSSELADWFARVPRGAAELLVSTCSTTGEDSNMGVPTRAGLS